MAADSLKISSLLRRNLAYYWRTHLAVVLGVATTVAVLAGALLVGDSVRASLRALALGRLGNAAYVVSSDGFFRQQLAAELRADSDFAKHFGEAVPLIALEGLVAHEPSRRRAGSVLVYGVDDAFWKIHGRDAPPRASQSRAALLSASLAAELGAAPGDAVLLRLQQPSEVPVESLHGRRDTLARSIRLTVETVFAESDSLGEFSLLPQQGAVRAIFVPLSRLQRDLDQESRANTLLLSQGASPPAQAAAELATILRRTFTLDDVGLRLRLLREQNAVSIESEKLVLADAPARAAGVAAEILQLSETRVFSYIANTIRARDREIPYSLVTAIAPLPANFSAVSADTASAPPIWLNAWAAADLGAKPGDAVTLEYFLWEEGGGLRTASAQFELRGILSMRGAATDRDFAPPYPGITDADSVGEWDPPFPIDLKRVRPRDEHYWDRYRTSPKAFVPLEVGQQLWGSRYGRLTAVRLAPPAGASATSSLESLRNELRSAIEPTESGLAVHGVREAALAASRGAVNFGEYFLYFSFFLVVSAVLLTGLFFKLGVEQRLREIGTLQALGFRDRVIARLFLLEGGALAVAGSAAGLAGGLGYAAAVMYGLRTWWVGAVGTTALQLHVVPSSLVLGGAAGMTTALLVIAWTLRGLRGASARSLLTGTAQPVAPAFQPGRAADSRSWRIKLLAAASAAVGLALLIAAATGRVGQVAGFFGSGTLLLVALIAFQWLVLARPGGAVLAGRGLLGLSRLGFRNASWRPGRSLLCIALIASATFTIVAVDSFRRDDRDASLDPKSGTGGYALLAESLVPLLYNADTPAGQRDLNLSDSEIQALAGARIVSFRMRPGEDASCLNLYQPRNPKILGAPAGFIAEGRFSFQASLADSPEEKSNPWRLLERELEDGAIPAIADANSAAYVLHIAPGDELTLDGVTDPRTGQPARLRLVATLADSVLQSELVISETNFRRVFPSFEGYRFFFVETAPERAGEATAALEQGLADFGLDVRRTGDRLASYHRVENTYLSTFQSLGGLGLLLGTVGLAAVLLRNVLERRRELALLRAVGFRQRDMGLLVLAENAQLLLGGLFSGVVSAALAIAPALAERGGPQSALTLILLLGAVFATGLAASLAAVVAVVRAPLLSILRAE